MDCYQIIFIEIPSQGNYPLRSVSAGKLKPLPSPSKSCHLFHRFSSQRSELFDNLYNVDPSFSKLDNNEKATYLLYCSSTSNPNILNKVVINLVIKVLKSTGHFDEPLIFNQ